MAYASPDELCSPQVFLLIDESTVRRYKADLTDEIEPQINELLSRAEKGLQLLLKRESVLEAKVGIPTGSDGTPTELQS